MGNKSNQDNQGLLQELQDRVDKWVEANPNSRNLAVLARKINVNDSTLRRMLAGECKLSFEAVALMLQEVCPSRKEMHSLVVKYFPKIVGDFIYLSEDDKKTARTNNSEAADINSLSECLAQTLNFKIWTFATAETYLLENIKEELGREGVRACQELISKNILEINDEGILTIRKNNRWRVGDLKLASTIFQKSVEFASQAEHQSFFNGIYWFNYESFKEAFRLATEYQTSLNKLDQKPESRGDIPFAVNQLLTRLDAAHSDNLQVKENSK